MIKDKLFNGIPAIFYKDRYLLFSPYAKKIISLNEEELKDTKLVEGLNKKGFFGKTGKSEEDSVKITFSLTDVCSMNCVYCFDSHCRNKNFMNKELALDILKKHIQMFPDKKFYIHFFGGEPTLNFAVIESVVKFLKNKKIEVFYRINTDGVVSEKKLNFMIDNNFHFDISCDGPPKIQNFQRPLKNGDSSLYVEKTIKFLVKKKADFKVKSVITKNSVKFMPKIVEYLADLGVKLIRLEPVIIHGKAEINGIESINPNDFVYYFFKSLEVAREKKVYVSNWAYRNILEPQDYFCRVLRSNRIIITPNGLITKCMQHANAQEDSPFVVGVFNNAKNLILDQKRIDFLKKLSVNDMPKCKSCFAKHICSGGCYYENLHSNGNFNIPTKEKCEITQQLLRRLIIEMYKKSSLKKNSMKKFKSELSSTN